MPEEGEGVASIEVLPTHQGQRDIFDRLGIAEGLMQSLDVDNWTRNMEALRDGYEPATFNVAIGSYTVTGFPEAQVQGRSVRLGSVNLDTAKAIIMAASANRITLDNYERDPFVFQLKTLSAIEDQAFLAMMGAKVVYADEDPSGSLAISVNGLRDVMGAYAQFRTSHRRDAIQTALRERMRESINPKKDAAKVTQWTSERAEQFSVYFKNIQAGLVVSENPFDDIDILPHGTLSSRFWGIEIEACDVEGVETPKYWIQKGDGSVRGLQHESLPSNSGNPPGSNPAVAPRTDHDADCQARVLEDGCTCTECYYDCNCGYEQERFTQEGRNTTTCEWNSPVLRSFHSRGLEYICEQIEYRRTNSSPGVHVHVEAADLTPDQVVQVGLIYSALEPMFVAEYKRQVRSYCKEMDLAEFVSRFKQAAAVKTMGSTVNVKNVFSGDRYFTVNTQSLRSHGTIEFRAMGARYNYEFLIRWAHFLREVINMAKANIPQKAWRNVKTFRDLIIVMSKYGKETPTPSWAADDYDPTPVVEKLGTENRRAPNEEVIRNVRTVFDNYASAAVEFGPSRNGRNF